ncbi:MAG: hypothetical protein PUH18_00665 [Coriobacteriaceae bacterium]|nr:hypothetical protein [Coriobacteriaceae bacterium]
MEQMQDDIKTSTANKRLSKEEEKLALWRAMDKRTHYARHAQELRGPYVE